MKKKKKVFLVVLGAVLLVVLVGGGLAWYWMTGPLYRPGMVRAGENLRSPLVPPAQAPGDDSWQVEKDIRLYHFGAGQGRNVLVVHGGPGIPAASAWPGLEPLAGSYRFTYYDQRGCGRSTRPFDRFPSGSYYRNMLTLEKALGMGAQIADIERIRRIMGEERIILIGHSFGGFIASMYAAEFPGHVKALVLVAPADLLAMGSGRGGKLFDEVRRRLPPERWKEYDAFIKEYLDFRNLFSRSEADLKALNARFGDYYRQIVKTDLPRPGEIGGWVVPALYLSLGMRHDYRKALREVTAPVLILQGSDDLQSAEVGEGYRTAFPHATTRTIPHAGHFIFYDRPRLFSQAVAGFLEGVR